MKVEPLLSKGKYRGVIGDDNSAEIAEAERV